MRVFHGLYNIAGIPSIMAAGERAHGIDSQSICFSSGATDYTSGIVEPPGVQTSDLIKRYQTYADKFDVFVFHFGLSLAYESLADIPLLKKKGKKIIFYFHGCDIRQSKETIKKYEFSACKECWPQKCSPSRDRALATAMEYADQIWVSSPDLLEFVPGSELFTQPVSLESRPYVYRHAEGYSQDRPVRILHAPSSIDLKGTKYIKEAVDRLKKENVAVELVLLTGVSHAQVMENLKEVDLGVDQILQGGYGMFSVELMAAGVPVMCYLRDDMNELYPEKPPMINVNPRTIYEGMRELVLNPDTWQGYSQRGRAYVEKHHDVGKAVQRSIHSYQSFGAKI